MSNETLHWLKMGAAFFFFAQLIVGVVTPLFVYKELCRLFDPLFKADLWFEDFATPWFPQIGRAGQYALWVANKRLFGINRPNVAGYDFKGQVTARTYRICVFHAINFSVFCCVWLPIGLVMVLQHWMG